MKAQNETILLELADFSFGFLKKYLYFDGTKRNGSPTRTKLLPHKKQIVLPLGTVDQQILV